MLEEPPEFLQGVTVTEDPAVRLHIYDVTTKRAVQRTNKVFRKLGTGAFHAAVEVFGAEYSFGGCQTGTGVFCCPPMSCEGHHYRETLDMGSTAKTMNETADIIFELSERWLGVEYDLLRHNCTHFCRELLERLEVEPMPRWVLNLAGAGATVADGFHKLKDKPQAVAIIAKAKANEIDAKYQVMAKFDKAETAIGRTCRAQCSAARTCSCIGQRRP